MHFTRQDLARTRVADGADPLWETALSLHSLRGSGADPALDAWRQHAVRHGPGPLRILLPLVPRHGYFPDFLTPYAGSEGVEPGLEAVMRTPRQRLREELAVLAESHPLPVLARDLADGEPAALRQLARGLRTYHHLAIAPGWSRIAERVAADLALRQHALGQSGTEALLRTFGAAMRWRPPVLEVRYPVERDLHLEGRGLLLVPSYFCDGPVAPADPGLPPVLVYPAGADAEGPRFRTERSGALRGVQTRIGTVIGTGTGAGVRSVA
ncbi:hypothetical protein [Streptomyces sp. NPDC048644]|uniref:hypothetical protein n=1 Tax=Streptomyces sp. NPDC048644 TaxID=3365582 RepID=UPI0037207F96